MQQAAANTKPESGVAGQFDSALALELARMSQAAYDDPPTIQDAVSDTQVLICEFDDHVRVAFRGTSDLRDWITDCDFLLVPSFDFGRFVEVHRGFNFAWNCIRSELLDDLRLHIGKPVIFAGHSLGGALAMLAAANLVDVINVRAVYTFGQPRVGNASLRDFYNQRLRARTFRIVGQSDAIPFMPAMLAGYHHAGTRVYIMQSGEIRFDPPLIGTIAADIYGAAKAWLTKHEFAPITNHHIGDYIKLLSGDSELETQNSQLGGGK